MTHSARSVITSSSIAQTEAFARELGERLTGGEIIHFRGDLGSGKTTFIRGLAAGLGVYDVDGVSSPSYTLINDYEGRIRLLHIDLYRLGSAAEIEDLDLLEMMDDNTVLAIEWSERIPEEFLQPTYLIECKYLDNHTRKIAIISNNSR